MRRFRKKIQPLAKETVLACVPRGRQGKLHTSKICLLMKKLIVQFGVALSLLLSASAAQAQEPCGCDWDFEPVCVEVEGIQFTWWNACDAECLGFTIVDEAGECAGDAWTDMLSDFEYEGECWEWMEDEVWESECECGYTDEDYNPVCVTLEDGLMVTFFSACEAECYGYTDYSEGECDYWEEPGDCDCADEEVYDLCVFDPIWGESYTWVGTDCLAACYGLEVLPADECETFEDPNECECDTDEVYTLCVFDPFWGASYEWQGTECLAACYGLEVLPEGECEAINPNDCECDEDEAPMDLCVFDPIWGESFAWVGTPCLAECCGFEILPEDECDFSNGDGACDCPEDEPIETYCVIDFETGEQYTVEGAFCALFCEGQFVLYPGDCDEGGNGDIDWCEGEPLETWCVLDPETDEFFEFEGTWCDLDAMGYWYYYEGPCDEEGNGDNTDPCDCPEDEPIETFCVLDVYTGEQYTVEGSFCSLFCEGQFVLFEGDCDEGGNGDIDWCEGEPVETWCVLDPATDEFFEFEGTWCDLDAMGYWFYYEGSCDEIEDGDGDNDGNNDGCDCPEDEPVAAYCVLDLYTGEQYTIEGTFCEIFCEGGIVIYEGDCDAMDEGDNGDNGDNVDPCDEDVVETFCVLDFETGEFFTYEGTYCDLEAMGYPLFFPGECDNLEGDGNTDEEDNGDGEGNLDECGCTGDEPVETLCAIDVTTGVLVAVTGSWCELLCEGFIVLGPGVCEESGDGVNGGGQQQFNGNADLTDFSVFPNPATDMVNINVSAAQGGTVQVEVRSVTGQLLTSEQWTLSGGTETRQLEISDLAPGLYAVSFITADGERLSKQILKQ